MASRILVLAPLLLCGYSVQTGVGSFMPGSSPATPNLAIDMCQRQAVPKQLNISHTGTHADSVYSWCTLHESVLPCLGRTLPSANSASDWFLKLIYNETRAIRMSKSICARFQHISNLTCVEHDMPAVGKCVQYTTKSAKQQFYGEFVPGQTLSEKSKKMASIYSCIISVATAGCFHKELTACSNPKRKLMYDFYIMLSGKCREIAGIPEPIATVTTKAPVVPTEDKAQSLQPAVGSPLPPIVDAITENELSGKTSFSRENSTDTDSGSSRTSGVLCISTLLTLVATLTLAIV